jgi:hypothetical protein
MVTGDHTTGSVIWREDADGNVLVNDPIAVAFKVSPTLTYSYSLSAEFEGGGSILCVATMRRTDGYYWYAGGGSLTKTRGEVELQLPAEVGEYTLNVVFVKSRPGGQGANEGRSHTVYNLLRAPLPTLDLGSALFPEATPRVEEPFVRYAVQWATGKSNAQGVLESLTQTMYANPLGWTYRGSVRVPYNLLEGAREANCWGFADTLQILATLNGIQVGRTLYRWEGLLPADRPPVGKAVTTGRAYNEYTGRIDGWYNGGHSMVTHNGKYYDPTFGYIGTYSKAYESNPERNWGENLLCWYDPYNAKIDPATGWIKAFKNGVVVNLVQYDNATGLFRYNTTYNWAYKLWNANRDRLAPPPPPPGA